MDLTTMTMPADFTPTQAFFWEHGGFSHLPDEPPAVGRERSARELADAEARAQAYELWITWDADPYGDVDGNHPAWWCGVATNGPADDSRADVIAALGGVTFADGMGPEDDPYARVVAAELAAEALDVIAEREAEEAAATERAEAEARIRLALDLCRHLDDRSDAHYAREARAMFAQLFADAETAGWFPPLP